MTKGGGGQKFQKIDDVFYERPLILLKNRAQLSKSFRFWKFTELPFHIHITGFCGIYRTLNIVCTLNWSLYIFSPHHVLLYT